MEIKHAMHFQWWETYLGLHLEFSSSPSNFFNCGPPAQTNNFILLTPWWRKCKDGGGHLDCKKGLDMVSLSCFFPILSYSKASLSQHIFTGPHIFSFHSRIGHQERGKHKPFWVTFNMFLCSAHSNFSSLHREFFQIPSLAVWFLTNIFLTNSSLTKFTSVFFLRGALNLVALGFYTAEHYISTHHLHIRLRSWLPLCICLPVCQCKAHHGWHGMCVRCVFGVRGLTVVSCEAWLSTGALSSYPLFRVIIWVNEWMISSRFYCACVPLQVP